MNGRSGPGKNFDVITTLELDAKVEVKDKSHGTWWCVEGPHGKEMWVHSGYLMKKRAAVTAAVKLKKNAGVGGGDVEPVQIPMPKPESLQIRAPQKKAAMRVGFKPPFLCEANLAE